MKTLKFLVLFLAAAMFLAACSTDGGNTDPEPTTGTLVVTVSELGTGTALASTITVRQGATVVGTQTGVSTYSWDLAPGSYSVSAQAAGHDVGGWSGAVVANASTAANIALAVTPLPPEPEEPAGVLSVSVGPVPGLIVVSNADGFVGSYEGFSTSWTLAPDDYTVTVSRDGFDVDRGPQTVSVVDGGMASVSFVLTAIVPEPQPVPTPAAIVVDPETSFIDEAGVAYHIELEENPHKVAWLTAAQTEEWVNVTMTVVDDAGAPIAGARATITPTQSATDGEQDGIVVRPGHHVSDGAMPMSATGGVEVVSDMDGHVHFAYFATGSRGSQAEEAPVKFVVTARGDDARFVDVEFKVSFVNMTHLYYVENNINYLTAGSSDFAWFSGARSGGVLEDVIVNEWDIRQNLQGPDGYRYPGNIHTFGAFARTKQPTSDPIEAPEFGDYSRVIYEVIAGDADSVIWFGCDNDSEDDGYCETTEESAAFVGVAPAADIDPTDLPIEVTIKATFILGWEMEGYDADDEYTIYTPLKDFTFTKRWVGSFVSIEKEVENHVLTWAGPDHTMDRKSTASSIPAEFRTTYTITVTNEGSWPVYNVVINDELPYELGLIAPSNNEITDDSGMIGTYNETNHRITWNYSKNPELTVMEPGEVVTVSFEVYARQKPGFCWESDEPTPRSLTPSAYTMLGYWQFYGQGGCEIDAEYYDPYKVINGGWIQQEVYAEYRLREELSAPPSRATYQVEGDESDIWVVRPVFYLYKERTSSENVGSGDSDTFRIDMGLQDLSNHAPFNPNPLLDYADLADLYPEEFNGNEGDTDTVTPDTRDNPYAWGVIVYDEFDAGLGEYDFDDASDFEDDFLGEIVEQTEWGYSGDVGEIGWDEFPVFGWNQNWTASIRLTIANDVNVDYIENCAYLEGENLNQPNWNEGSFDEDMIENYELEWFGDWDLYLEYCAGQNPDDFFGEAVMNLTSMGEDDETGWGGSGDEPALDGDSQFWYRYRSTNIGDETATGVEFHFVYLGDVDYANLAWVTTNTEVWYRANDAATPIQIPFTVYPGGTFNGGTDYYDLRVFVGDVAPGAQVRVVVPAYNDGSDPFCGALGTALTYYDPFDFDDIGPDIEITSSTSSCEWEADDF